MVERLKTSAAIVEGWVIHRGDNTVKSNMSADRHNFKTLVSYWYKGDVFGFECKSRSYVKHNFALDLLLIEIL